MKNRPSTIPDTEQVIGSIPKNRNGDVLRVTLQRFRGSLYISFRVFFTGDDGIERAGRGGMNLRAAILPQLLAVLNLAKTAIDANLAPAGEPIEETGDAA